MFGRLQLRLHRRGGRQEGIFLTLRERRRRGRKRRGEKQEETFLPRKAYQYVLEKAVGITSSNAPLDELAAPEEGGDADVKVDGLKPIA